ncbi:MAG: YigZ family protein [Chloroflexota bacterium]|nr:MAG: YigZ family protein [Chloroflexota bacterium]
MIIAIVVCMIICFLLGQYICILGRGILVNLFPAYQITRFLPHPILHQLTTRIFISVIQYNFVCKKCHRLNIMNNYPIPAQETQAETRVANSRFIATLGPVFSVEDAKTFIERIKAKYADATHNVPVFLVGHGASVTAHSSDDGEPSGTAGRPALAVLRGSGLGDVAVVVTRYFGGTKLGTGGLVRAYGNAVRAVLEVTPRAQKISTHIAKLVTPYPYFERIQQMIAKNKGLILHNEFTAEVAITCQFPVERFEHFQGQLQELTGGTVQAEIIEENKIAIM